jgi:hypothetical protein
MAHKGELGSVKNTPDFSGNTGGKHGNVYGKKPCKMAKIFSLGPASKAFCLTECSLNMYNPIYTACLKNVPGNRRAA